MENVSLSPVTIVQYLLTIASQTKTDLCCSRYLLYWTPIRNLVSGRRWACSTYWAAIPVSRCTLSRWIVEKNATTGKTSHDSQRHNRERHTAIIVQSATRISPHIMREERSIFWRHREDWSIETLIGDGRTTIPTESHAESIWFNFVCTSWTLEIKEFPWSTVHLKRKKITISKIHLYNNSNTPSSTLYLIRRSVESSTTTARALVANTNLVFFNTHCHRRTLPLPHRHYYVH